MKDAWVWHKDISVRGEWWKGSVWERPRGSACVLGPSVSDLRWEVGCWVGLGGMCVARLKELGPHPEGGGKTQQVWCRAVPVRLKWKVASRRKEAEFRPGVSGRVSMARMRNT